MSLVLPSVEKLDYAIHSNVEQMKSAVQRQMAVYVSLVLIVMIMANVSGKETFLTWTSFNQDN